MALIDLNIPAGVYRNGTDLQSKGRWRDANLVRWHDGVMRPIGGWRTRSSDQASAPLRGMLSWVDNGNNAHVASGSFDRLYAWSAAGFIQDITPSNLTVGRIDADAFTGFGGGFFGTSTYGTVRPFTSRVQPATSWNLQPWGEYLIAMNSDDGKIYEWDLGTTLGDELVLTPDFASDTNWTKGNGGAGGSNWSIAGGIAKYAHLIETFDGGDDVITDPATDTITITGHGLVDGDEVIYSVPAAPATAISGLTDGNTYYIISATANTFQLSATSGGAAVNLTPSNSLTFDGDDPAVVNAATNKIVEANTFSTGDYVEYDNGGGVDIGGLTNGANYYIIAATASEFQLSLTSGGAAIDLTPDNAVLFDGDDVAVVDVASDKILVANTFADGDELTYDNGGGVDIGGLTTGTNYFVINATATEFQLSATSGGAAITLTANNSVTFDGDDATVVDVATDTIIQANTFTSGDLVTYSAGGGVAIGGLTDGANYFIVSATATDFQLSLTSGGAAVTLTANNSVTVDATDAAVVDVATDVITIANTFADGEIVTYDNGGGTDIAGLVNGTDYYIINASATDFQVSATSGGAAVDLTALGTGTAHVFRQDIGSSHEVRADIGSAHTLDQDIGSAHLFRVDAGTGHELSRQNYGNLEQVVDGLNSTIYFDATDATVVDFANDKFVIASDLVEDEQVIYNVDGGTAVGGLTDGATYFVVNRTATTFQLALTAGGTPITLTGVGVGTTHDFRNTLTDRDTHALLVTLTDPDDDSDPATVPSVSVLVTTTATSTVLVDEELAFGENRFHFDTLEDEVTVEIIPAAFDTPNFEIDDVSLRVTPAADLIEEAPIDNLGIVVTEERFLFALGAGGNPRKVQWCDREDNTQWTPATTNEAGDLELNTAGQLMAGCNVRGQTLLLTTRDAHVATYVGPPYVYGIERVGTSCGLAAPQAYSVVDAGCFWMGVNSFYSYTGSQAQELQSEISDYIFNDINRAQISKVFAVSNSMFGEIWWFYPSAGSLENDRYVTFNYIENTWNIGELSRTAGVDRGAFPLPQMADPSDFKIYEHEVGFNYDSLIPFAETGPLMIGAGDTVASVVEMIPDEKTQGDVEATFKTRFYPNGTERSYGPYDMANPTSLRFTGRQVRMRVSGVEFGDWRVGVNRLDVVSGGRR